VNSTTGIYHVYFDDDLQAIVMEWNGYATSNEFREGTELMLNTLIQHRCSRVLADIREMTLIGQEDQKWVEHIFLPRAKKFGFTEIAIVRPKAYFNKVAVETLSDKISRETFTLNVFDSLEEAKSWLQRSLFQ